MASVGGSGSAAAAGYTRLHIGSGLAIKSPSVTAANGFCLTENAEAVLT